MTKLSPLSRKQKVTLSIDTDIYKHFRSYCEENAIMLSKKIELWMKREVELTNDLALRCGGKGGKNER